MSYMNVTQSKMRRAILLFVASLSLTTAVGYGQDLTSPYTVSKIIAAMRQPPSDLVLLSAHRASWQYYPENSLPAVVDVFNRKIETLEVDARLTKDNHVVISHDYVLDRVSNGAGFLYQTTWAQVQALSLRDRTGKVYTEGPSNSTLQFLDFGDLLSILQNRADATHGYVAIVDIKGAADDQDPTDPMTVLTNCLQVMAQMKSTLKPSVLQSIVFKLKSKDMPSRSAFEAATGWKTAADGGLIVVLNPDDVQVVAAKYVPAADSFFQTWLEAPYLVHFEMNQSYSGDGLQNYINYLQNHTGGTQVGFATYYEPYYFPEGVANSAGFCCFPHSQDVTKTRLDYRGDPTFSILYGTALVTTDAVDSLSEILTLQGKRNLSRIK